MTQVFRNISFFIFFLFLLACQQQPSYKIAPHSPEQEGVQPGQYIPRIHLLDTLMQQVNIEQVMGKATMIDFWASWCRPCRESANPAYLKLYKKYHPKGLQIVGISSDRHQYFWKKALRQDSLPWYQFIDSTHIILRQFKVKSIPAMLLIDRHGKIVGRNLWGKDLQHKIDSLLSE